LGSKQDKLNAAEAKRAAAGLIESWMPREEFNALLNECHLVDKIAELYLKAWWDNCKNSGWVTEERLSEIQEELKPVANQIRDQLTERLHLAAGLLAYELTVSRDTPIKKGMLRFLVDLFFFQGSTLPMRDGRGRKPLLTESKVRAAIKKLGGRPSRNRLAKELETTPATILNWVKSKGFNSLNDLLAASEKGRQK
jgi:hypothetical protein